MAERLTITNYRRRRGWGWGYSSIPTGRGTEIETPTVPWFTGTIGQIMQARSEDRVLAAEQGAFSQSAWFWRGRRVQGAVCDDDLALVSLTWWLQVYGATGVYPDITIMVE